MAQAVARRLIEAKLPAPIVNVSSQMGHVGAARRTVYCASKHAMEGFYQGDGDRARARTTSASTSLGRPSSRRR